MNMSTPIRNFSNGAGVLLEDFVGTAVLGAVVLQEAAAEDITERDDGFFEITGQSTLSEIL